MNSSKLLTLVTLLIASLAFTNCSSKKKSAGETTEEYPKDSFADESLVLNGDSDSGKAGELRTIYFAYNVSSLSDEGKEVLTSNADFLKKNPSVEIQVEGHADERGGIEYNLALGQKRAASVKNFLVAMGVEGNRISTVSYGKERPIEFGHSESSWSKNRRGNFVVTAK